MWYLLQRPAKLFDFVQVLLVLSHLTVIAASLLLLAAAAAFPLLPARAGRSMRASPDPTAAAKPPAEAGSSRQPPQAPTTTAQDGSASGPAAAANRGLAASIRRVKGRAVRSLERTAERLWVLWGGLREPVIILGGPHKCGSALLVMALLYRSTIVGHTGAIQGHAWWLLSSMCSWHEHVARHPAALAALGVLSAEFHKVRQLVFFFWGGGAAGGGQEAGRRGGRGGGGAGEERGRGGQRRAVKQMRGSCWGMHREGRGARCMLGP